jgi:hypothetical protein
MIARRSVPDGLYIAIGDPRDVISALDRRRREKF